MYRTLIVFVAGAAVGAAGTHLLSQAIGGMQAEEAASDDSEEGGHVPCRHVDIQKLVRERSEASIALKEQTSRLWDEKEYDAAIRVCGRLLALDRDAAMGLLGASCGLAGRDKEYVDYALSVYDFGRMDPHSTMVGVFQALERSGDLPRGWEILRQRERALPPDVVAFYRAGLLAIEGKKDEALRLLAQLRDDPYWRSPLESHPVESGSFLAEKRRFEGKTGGKYPGGWEHPMFPEELNRRLERSAKALWGGEDR